MLSALISGGANIVGGLLNRKSAQEANAINQANADRNAAMQAEFAQQGIRWKVADAKAAGIHPLYALGAQTTSFSPVSVGATADTSMGTALGNAGQDISRAINTTRTTPEKVAAIQTSALAMEGMKLDNEIKKTQIASSLQRLQQTKTPSIPALGEGETFGPGTAKIEDRPPLMMGGSRVKTDPGTSPMKAYEDQFGDDGPLSWLAQLAVGYQTLRHNIREARHPYLAQQSRKLPWNQSRQERQR